MAQAAIYRQEYLLDQIIWLLKCSASSEK